MYKKNFISTGVPLLSYMFYRKYQQSETMSLMSDILYQSPPFLYLQITYTFFTTLWCAIAHQPSPYKGTQPLILQLLHSCSLVSIKERRYVSTKR